MCIGVGVLSDVEIVGPRQENKRCKLRSLGGMRAKYINILWNGRQGVVEEAACWDEVGRSEGEHEQEGGMQGTTACNLSDQETVPCAMHQPI